jgi:hypothetical protein
MSWILLMLAIFLLVSLNFLIENKQKSIKVSPFSKPIKKKV